MKKQMLSLALFCFLLCTLMIPSLAENPQKEGAAFTVISIPCPEGEKLWEENYDQFSRLMARYADDQTPIPLSQYYDGNLFATVPADYASREIESFVAEDKIFTDFNENKYEYYQMMQLAHRGLVEGNEKGELLPFQNVSRAEAVAFIVRLLGIDIQASSPTQFKDVPLDAWFADEVAAVEECGIVYGDSDTTFSPNRTTSREEFTVMVARALWYTGLRIQNPDVTLEELNGKIGLQDADSISPWALSAYDTIDSYAITDDSFIDKNGPDDVLLYANPKKYVTRAEAASLLCWIYEGFQNYPSQEAIHYGFDKTMPVIDGSTSTYPYIQAVYQSLFSCGYQHPGLPESFSKSHASYQRLINVWMVYIEIEFAPTIGAI